MGMDLKNDFAKLLLETIKPEVQSIREDLGLIKEKAEAFDNKLSETLSLLDDLRAEVKQAVDKTNKRPEKPSTD